MTKLTIGETNYNCESDETVLDALLKQNLDISFACKKGVCHSCMLRSMDTPPPLEAQQGLKDTLQAQGYFLSCLCKPEKDMLIRLPTQSELFSEVEVLAYEPLNHDTVSLILSCHDSQEYRAGQFVNLQRSDGLTRSYSIANLPTQTGTLNFHIRRLPGGRFSEWVYNELKVGDKLAISEPKGHCFYLPDRKQQGLLLVGTGSGLAPLAGILEDALAHGHTGPIHLFHGSREIDDLYRVNEMRELAEKHDNFHYTPCVSRGKVTDGFTQGRVNEVAIKTMPDLKGWRIFLCGHPEMVNKMKTDVFLKGVTSADIYTDAFHVAQAETGV